MLVKGVLQGNSINSSTNRELTQEMMVRKIL